ASHERLRSDMQNQDWPYPTIDKPLPLTGGDVVQLYSLIIFVPTSGDKALTIQYGTSIPATDRRGVIDQALAVATALTEFADTQGIRRANAQICRTRAQAETREPIAESVVLARGSDGSWIEDFDLSDRGA